MELRKGEGELGEELPTKWYHPPGTGLGQASEKGERVAGVLAMRCATRH